MIVLRRPPTAVIAACVAVCLSAGLGLSPPASAQRVCPPPPSPDPVSFGPPVVMTVTTDRGDYAFATELARSGAQKSRGMMFRPTVAPDEAMLFVFDDDAPRSFFMRNTCAPLDLVWVTKDLEVAGVSADATPYDETSIPSPEPVRFVWEIAGGRAAAIGLKPGDRLRFGAPLAAASDAAADDAAAAGVSDARGEAPGRTPSGRTAADEAAPEPPGPRSP